MTDRPLADVIAEGRAQVLDLASRVESYCEPPQLAKGAAILIRVLVRQRDADIAEMAVLRAAVRDASMSLANYDIDSEWAMRHAAVIARAMEDGNG